MMLPPQVKSMESNSRILKPLKCKIFPAIRTLFCTTSSEKDNLEAYSTTLELPESIKSSHVFIEPRHENKIDDWPPMQICELENGKIRIENRTETYI